MPDWCTCGAEQRVDKWWKLSGALAVHSTSITAITPTVLIPSISVYTYCSALPLTHPSHYHSCRFDSISILEYTYCTALPLSYTSHSYRSLVMPLRYDAGLVHVGGMQSSWSAWGRIYCCTCGAEQLVTEGRILLLHLRAEQLVTEG